MSRPQYTTRDLADATGTSTQHWRNQVDDGLLHATTNVKRKGRRLLRFSIDDIRAYDSQLAVRLLAHQQCGTSN